MRLIIAHQTVEVAIGIFEKEGPGDPGDDLRRAIFKPGDAVAHRAEARDRAIVEDMDAAEERRVARNALVELEARAEIGMAREHRILLAGRRCETVAP